MKAISCKLLATSLSLLILIYSMPYLFDMAFLYDLIVTLRSPKICHSERREES